MSTELDKNRLFSPIFTLVLALVFVVACEASSTIGTAGSEVSSPGVGGNSNGGQIALGSGGSVTSGASGNAVTGAGMSVTGGIAASGNGATSGSIEPTVCEAPVPNCAGLSGCDLTICVLKRGSDEGQIPSACSCLSGDAQAQCCAQVREGMQKFNCLDLTEYPECEIKLECPRDLIANLNTNPAYPIAAAPFSQECVDCLCTNCIEDFDRLARSDQTAVTLLQCALSNNVRKDCVVCNPPPCDTTLGTNMLTGPCGQELMAACPDCSCAGPFDPSCFSLAGCMTETTVSTLPCRTAHMSLECLASNCPVCQAVPECPSNFGN